MNQLFRLLVILRKGYKLLFKNNDIFSDSKIITDYDKVSLSIYNSLLTERPVMIARLGAFELSSATNYYGIYKCKHSVLGFITGKTPQWWWNEKTLSSLNTNAGVFPLDKELVSRFCQATIDSMPFVDILASWQANERFFKKELEGSQKVILPGLEPFWASQPWSRALKGKKVVVVHPFAETISAQYTRRAFLFKNNEILPDFDLRVVRAVQSINGVCTDYNNWFEALNAMEVEIFSEDFDICLLGCGAYGFVLAANIKKRGKKAFHMGGSLQLMFGIKGHRWDNRDHSRFYNEYWVRPNENEIPANAVNIEGGCYW